MNTKEISGLKSRHWIFIAIFLLVIIGLVSGCSDERTTEPGQIAWEVVPGAGCKTGEVVNPGSDCIEYVFSDGVLSITHINAGFNCCTDVGGDIEIEDNVITITEKESGDYCFCLCLYDVDYEIEGLQAAEYTIVIEELCLDDGDELMEFTVDLISSPSGTHCIERDHYPWDEGN